MLDLIHLKKTREGRNIVYEYFIDIYFGKPETINFLFILLLLIHKSQLASVTL